MFQNLLFNKVCSIAYRFSYLPSCFFPIEFWGDLAKGFYWNSPPTGAILDYNFDVTKGDIYVNFMKGATTNICYNLLDRKKQENEWGEKIAYYW